MPRIFWSRNSSWPVRLAQVGLLIWVAFSFGFQNNVGLADNGDYLLTMRLFTSGPVSIEPNWPPAGTAAWNNRFFNYWIPEWKFQWSYSRPISSVELLWLPGAVLNYVFYSPSILDLRALSLFPKALLLIVVLLLFGWIDQQSSRYRLPLYLAGALPLVLIVTTTDYLAYFNTFYRETASLVFLILLLASLLALRQRPGSRARLLLCLSMILLLAAAKPSAFYWGVLAVPAVVYATGLGQTLGEYAKQYLLWGLGATVLLLAAAGFVTHHSGCTQCNRYHSLFCGTLVFSRQPEAHLAALGMSDAIDCIGVRAFVPPGTACIAKYGNRISFRDSLRIIIDEPMIALRMIGYATDNMQDISLEYLGHYARDNPTIQAPSITFCDNCSNRFWSANSTSPQNLWSSLKYHIFPTGGWLIVALVGFAALSLWGLTRGRLLADLSLLGLLAVFGCLADMSVAIAGEGVSELIKHLFLANALFDVSAVIAVCLIVVLCVDLIAVK